MLGKLRDFSKSKLAGVLITIIIIHIFTCINIVILMSTIILTIKPPNGDKSEG